MKKTQKLEKLTVQCYTKAIRSGSPEDTFQVSFNPESYTHRFLNALTTRQGIATLGIREAYAYARPEELSFTLVFDTTVEDGDRQTSEVFPAVRDFLSATYHSVGEIHAPYYLRLVWGELSFNCRLQQAEVTYSDFGPNGIPYRAEVQARFIGESEDPTGSKTFNSPDLTHIRTTGAGDSLPLMTKRIYGSSLVMVALAHANGLDSLRLLPPGRQLHFPPLKT